MYISGRERKLIETLLSYDEPIPVNRLSEELDVSVRTVHRDLNNLESIIQDYHLTIHKKSGVGVELSGDEHNQEQLKHAILQLEHTDYTPEERQSIILTTLLEAQDPIKLYALANELQVTIATVSHDLDYLQPLLEQYELSLIRKRGYGVKIDGEEKQKRSAMSYLISKHVDESELIHLLSKNIEHDSKQMNSISHRLLDLVEHDKLSRVKEAVNQANADLPYELADNAYIGLIVHLTLAMERLQKGETIQFDQAYLADLEDSTEFQIAQKMIEKLEKAFDMTIPRDEIGYITMHLLGAKLRYDHDYLLEESSLDMAFKAKELIDFVNRRMERFVFEQDQILNDLVAHLKPAVFRLSQGMNIKNPLASQIETDHPVLFEIIEEGVHHVFPQLTFPKEEVAYLVLHFASTMLKMEEDLRFNVLVVCSSGIGTSKMLATKINQHFSEISSVDHGSLFDIERLDLEKYDFMVSTVPIQNMSNEYVLVSPMLDQNDIREINRFIHKQRVSRNVGKTNRSEDSSTHDVDVKASQPNHPLPIIDDVSVHPIKKNLSLEQTVRTICEVLLNHDVIRDDQVVSDQLLKRLDSGGVGIPNTSLALFHTRNREVVKPSLTIYPLKTPIKVRGMDDQWMEMRHMMVMISPESVDQHELEVLSSISELLVKDDQAISIFESQQEETIKAYLASQLT
ncbi:BglG family transcription antiterminator [Alkalibacillus salilacus]|uniref:Mannitol operon transcriptional antiterminator n=1 Tax=Alkalibacillus salilacus TaxID=284582 RepID=A0ABT9VE68_9BACI|nr:BglG family transcription antiterminator [Alkalibacillus salilacus]MDQ0159264.1 mannitol operon transcriptional antiterminator [Alkalibacillus salilacus]